MENQNTSVIKQTPNQERERGACTYLVAGQEVNLSYAIVKNFLTKGNGQVTDQDLTQFISICKYNQLNPFLNEAFLIKYGDKPASMIVSKEALMKRAETHEGYRGIQAGIIVMRDGQPVELEGSFFLANDILAGGWAKVYRKDRDYPYVSKVKLSEYDKKQSIWTEKPSTMIRKVAEVQALREAFPTQLGALYTAEEVGVTVEDSVAEVIKEKANKKEISIDQSVTGTVTKVDPQVAYTHTQQEEAKPDF
jgi:phage recombination protein Bet